MKKNDWKIAWRNLWKNKVFSLMNIVGLTLGFTGFILSYQYINRETSYDKWNPNYDRIYQVGLEANGEYTAETPPSLAVLVKENFPEIELAGRLMIYPYGGYPLFGESTVYMKNAALLDSSAAEIFQVKSKNGPLFKRRDQKEASLINERDANLIFKPADLAFNEPKSVPWLSLRSEMKENIYGVIKERPLSLINYDLLLIKEIFDERAVGNPFTYQTFIQVRPGTDIEALNRKMTNLFLKEIAPHDRIKSSAYAKGNTYIDALSNLHLQPKAGSNTAYLIVLIIGTLSIVILILASANFTNMIMAQADQRSKELAIKKVLGSSRLAIMMQLFAEVLMLTFIAAGLSLILLNITGNVLQKWFNDDLKQYLVSNKTLVQISIAILATTLISGVYPAVVLSGYKTIHLLKGGLTKASGKFSVRNALLTFQIVFAIIFIVGMIVVQKQIKYIQTADKGFEPAQIITFNGIGLHYNASISGNFEDFKQRLENNPNIESVSSPTNVPGNGELPPKKDFIFNNHKFDLAHVGIDTRYFKTLNIGRIAGDENLSLDQILKDSLANYAVINETAAKTLGINNPIGATISGCDVNFKIIAVVKDSKTYGFENTVNPTVYSYKNECGPGRYKISLMVKTVSGRVDQAIEAVKNEWEKNESSKDLPLDYRFMDLQYANLHAKQKEMQSAFNIFTLISVLISALGLFSMSAYQVTVKQKEMSVRKVLGASIHRIFIQLNKPFFKVFIISCLIAIPASFLLIKNWLNNFAYHIEIRWWYFGVATLIVLSIILLTISFQSIKAAKANPVDSLKEE